MTMFDPSEVTREIIEKLGWRYPYKLLEQDVEIVVQGRLERLRRDLTEQSMRGDDPSCLIVNEDRDHVSQSSIPLTPD